MHQTDIAMFAMTEDVPTAFAWAMGGEGAASWNADTVGTWLKSGRTLLLRHKSDSDTEDMFRQVWKPVIQTEA